MDTYWWFLTLEKRSHCTTLLSIPKEKLSKKNCWIKQARKTAQDYWNRAERMNSVLLQPKGGEILSTRVGKWKNTKRHQQGVWSMWLAICVCWLAVTKVRVLPCYGDMEIWALFSWSLHSKIWLPISWERHFWFVKPTQLAGNWKICISQRH